MLLYAGIYMATFKVNAHISFNTNVSIRETVDMLKE